jgi:uncharacterized protein YbcI
MNPDLDPKGPARPDAEPPPGAGFLLRLTNGISRLQAQHFGKGPTKARSYMLGSEILVVVGRDNLTQGELTLVQNGEGEQVQAYRKAFRDATREPFVALVEELSGRRVTAYLGQNSLEPDIAIGVFFLDAPRPEEDPEIQG